MPSISLPRAHEAADVASTAHEAVGVASIEPADSDETASSLDSLPLFLPGQLHLYPHTTKRLHLFEGRYKLMIERVLLGNHRFGWLSAGAIGTVAHVESWQLLPDGAALVEVHGLSRFQVSQQWTEDCEGCDSGPLHIADVDFFNDTSGAIGGEDKGDAILGKGDAKLLAPRKDDAELLAQESLVLYHSLTGPTVHEALQEQHGSIPSVLRNGSYAASMWLAAACTSHPLCEPLGEELLLGNSTAARLQRILAFQHQLLGGGTGKISAQTAAAEPLSTVRLRSLPRALEQGTDMAGLHGKLLLLHPSAVRAGASGKVVLLSYEPRAAGGVLRGLDLFTSTGKQVREVTQDKYLADFAPHLDRLDVFLAGDGDAAGQCGFTAVHAWEGLPSTRSALGGQLQLTDLQLDYAPDGGGRALLKLKALLGSLGSRAERRAAAKMLIGCRTWTLEQLESQLELGMWRMVEVVEGERELSAAALRAQDGSDAGMAVWQALRSVASGSGPNGWRLGIEG